MTEGWRLLFYSPSVPTRCCFSVKDPPTTTPSVSPYLLSHVVSSRNGTHS